MSQIEAYKLLKKVSPKKVTLKYFRKNIKNCPTSITTALMKLRRCNIIKAVKMKEKIKKNSWGKNRLVWYYWV